MLTLPGRPTGRPARRRRLVSLLTASVLAVAVAPALTTPAHAAGTDPVKVGLYGTADPTYDGVFRQSVAVLAITAAGQQPAEEAVQWLLDQQCADGGFMAFNPTPSKPCLAPDPASFAGQDTNSTALAVQALLSLGRTTEATKAVGFLTGAQNGDGGWPYIPGGDSDPNSTGLVMTALSAAGRGVSQDALGYLRGMQVGCSGDPADQGGITTAWSGGAPDLLATVQAVPGAAGLHLDQLPAAGDAWADGVPTFACPVDTSDADTLAGWGAAWLDAQAGGGTVTGGNAAWAVLAFAGTRTGHDQAQALFAGLVKALGDAPKAKATPTGSTQSTEDPGQLGLTALAGAALGTDVSSLADRLAATVTRPQAQPSASPSPSRSAQGGDGDQGGGTAPGGAELPDTGTGPGLAVLGLLLVGTGGLLLALTRRRRDTA